MASDSHLDLLKRNNSNIYVKTNFVLELAFLQEQPESYVKLEGQPWYFQLFVLPSHTNLTLDSIRKPRHLFQQHLWCRRLSSGPLLRPDLLIQLRLGLGAALLVEQFERWHQQKYIAPRATGRPP